ncbi:hypothetical protein ES5_11686 [Dietzia cinnamea P4]|nr:hypothetical protein ES5_11686 [Dietzia cinnamea P4]
MIAAGLCGALLTNAVPHTVKGLTGERFPTPFATPPGVGLSPPLHNVAWGLLNLAAGGALARRVESPRDRAAAATGGVAMAFVLAHYFGGLDLSDDRAER